MVEDSADDEALIVQALRRGGFDPKTSNNGVFADAAAFNKKMKVVFLGIGSVEGSPIIDPVTRESKKDENGQIVISKLNETELSQLADATNGIYIRLENMDAALITLTQRLDGIEKRALTDTDYIIYKNYFQWFLGAALLLLLIEFFLPERKMKLT